MTETAALIQPRIIALGGGWEVAPSPDLTIETRMRLLALGELAATHHFEYAVFSGGLKGGAQGRPETIGMKAFFDEQYPSRDLKLVLDDDCWDTASSAKAVQRLLGENAKEPHTLLTSKTHLPRATTTFRRQGLSVEPISAESVLLRSGNDDLVDMTERYLHSNGYYKRLLLEGVMRAALLIDRDGSISKRVAEIVRNDQIPVKEA